jgi:hypothetical protein
MPSHPVGPTPLLLCEHKQQHGNFLGHTTPYATLLRRGLGHLLSYHIALLCTPYPASNHVPYHTMFGSSEDRARQLAYRTRKDRVISSGSNSTHRSLSSASESSRRSHSSLSLHMGLNQSIAPEIPLSVQAGLVHGKDHATSRVLPWDDPALASSSHDDSLPAKQCKDVHVEQHRVQSEYLSQVLYNSLSIVAQGLSEAASVPALQLNRYAIWPWHL